MTNYIDRIPEFYERKGADALATKIQKSNDGRFCFGIPTHNDFILNIALTQLTLEVNSKDNQRYLKLEGTWSVGSDKEDSGKIVLVWLGSVNNYDGRSQFSGSLPPKFFGPRGRVSVSCPKACVDSVLLTQAQLPKKKVLKRKNRFLASIY